MGADHAERRGNIDDRPRRMRRQVGHGVLAAEKDAAQVDGDDPIPVVFGSSSAGASAPGMPALLTRISMWPCAPPRRQPSPAPRPAPQHRRRRTRRRYLGLGEAAPSGSPRRCAGRRQDHGPSSRPKRDRPADASRRPRDDGHPTCQPPASMLHGSAPPAYGFRATGDIVWQAIQATSRQGPRRIQ